MKLWSSRLLGATRAPNRRLMNLLVVIRVSLMFLSEIQSINGLNFSAYRWRSLKATNSLVCLLRSRRIILSSVQAETVLAFRGVHLDFKGQGTCSGNLLKEDGFTDIRLNLLIPKAFIIFIDWVRPPRSLKDASSSAHLETPRVAIRPLARILERSIRGALTKEARDALTSLAPSPPSCPRLASTIGRGKTRGDKAREGSRGAADV